MWKHLVDGRFWLCPYCGMVGANADTLSKLPELATTHLLSQCTTWKNFEGTYVHIKKLEERAMDVLATHKLANDPSWKLFDEGGRWYCPYCTKGKQVENLRSPEGMTNAKAAISAHLRECHLYKGGKGVPMPHDQLSKHVAVQNLVTRLAPQVKRRLELDEIWGKRWTDGSWVCPFCHKPINDVDISTQLTRTETAPTQMATHLVRDCQVYAKSPELKGQPAHVLKPVPGALQKRLTQIVQKMHTPLDDDSSEGELGTAPVDEPLPAPKLSFFTEESATDTATTKEGFAKGRVQMARYGGESAPPESSAENAMRSEMAMRSSTRRVEKPPEEAPPPPPPVDVEQALGPADEEDAAEPIETITGKKRRALTGMIQRAKVRLLSMVTELPKQSTVEVGVLFRPSRSFQGDFYFFHEYGPKRVGVGIYNLSVKGVDMVPLNELVMEKVKGAVRAEVDPKALLCRLNQELFGLFERGHYATMLYGVVDLNNKVFQFCNAGHCPPIVENPYAGKDCIVYRSNGIVVGQDEGPMFQALLETVSIPLEKRDMIVLHTEGILQSVGGSKKREYEFKGLASTLREYSKQDAHFLIDMVETSILEFLGDQPQDQDLTVVAIRVA